MKTFHRRKEERREKLLLLLRENPCLTDRELANYFSVSVATIRLDRQTLRVPQMRERMEEMFSRQTLEHRNSLEILDVEKGKKGVALLRTTKEMANDSGIVLAECLYGASTKFAQALTGMTFAPVQVGNIKYKSPVMPGDQLVLKGKVAMMRGNKKYIYIHFFREEEEIFRTKFIMDVERSEVTE